MSLTSLKIAEAAGLQNGTVSGAEHYFHCPGKGHNGGDSKPSMSINVDKDEWYCQRCNEGGGPKQLKTFLKKNGVKIAKPKIIAKYDYVDETGGLLYQKLRDEDKEFTFRKPDSSKRDGWVYKLGDDVRRVIYNLPNVLKADLVFVVEGEKDSDNMGAVGLTATTNDNGAEHWTDALSDFFKSHQKVVVLPDNDKAGRKHANAVAVSLHGKTKSLKVVNLPGLQERGDISDWLAAGGTAQQLMTLVDEASEFQPSHDDIDNKHKSKYPSSRLLKIAEGLELFHNKNGAYASAMIDGHRETWPIKSSDFRGYLSSQYWSLFRAAVSDKSMTEVLNTIQARARFEGTQRSVHYRVAQHDGKIYLDLGDAARNIVEMSPDSWRIVQDAPVRFVRHANMGAIPIPEHGGSIDGLRPFLNVATDDDFILAVAFLVGALRPDYPFAFLAISGEHGSCKTTFSRILKSLIDPNTVKEGSLPTNRRDLAVSAQKNWILSFGNVSSISPDMSDALCSVSTGGGYSTRSLFTDDEEKVFVFQRPVILNGIGEIVNRPDLLDRTILLRLEPMPEDKRREEEIFNAEFEAARSRILGALCDHVVQALRDIDSVKLDSKPRMADFTRWAVASGIPGFLETYSKHCKELHRIALDGSPVGQGILKLMKDQITWGGTYQELLEALGYSDGFRPKGWPENPRALSSAVDRIIPALRAAGLQIIPDGRSNQGKKIRIDKTDKAA